MSGDKNTHGHVVDYSILVGKVRSLKDKQNGTPLKNVKIEMSIEEKYATPTGKKVVRNQIVGNVKDDRTGSMMPVVLEQMVDGTKSKKTGRHVSHMPNMAIVSNANKKNRSQWEVAQTQKGKKMEKNYSDLEIVEEKSGDGSDLEIDQKMEKQIKLCQKQPNELNLSFKMQG